MFNFIYESNYEINVKHLQPWQSFGILLTHGLENSL